MFVILSCLFNTAVWSPTGKGLTSRLSCLWCFVVFCHFPVWCPGSGVVLDCIIPDICLLTYFDLDLVLENGADTDEIQHHVAYHLIFAVCKELDKRFLVY